MSLSNRTAFRALAAPLAAVLLILLGATPALATKVTFRYQPVIGGVSSVAVAGSFNGWNATANPLADADKDGVWSADIEIAPGRVEYKFVVNGDQWFTDENAAEFSSDGFGGQNAVLVLKDQPVIAGHGGTAKKADEPKMGLRQVPFKFRPATKTSEPISLAGQFNDWGVGKTLLTDPDGDGEYAVTLLLAPGAYQYKFVVGSSGWTQDTAGQDGESDDGYGGKNSIRNVDDRFASIAVKKGDGQVFADGVTHTQGGGELNNLGGGRVQFTARAHRDDVDGVDLVTWAAGKEAVTPMRPGNRDKVYEYYRVEIAMPAGTVPYAFRYRDGKAAQWLGPKGLTASNAERFTFDPAKNPPFVTPDWVRHGIIYQIFPDRFRNGNPANDQDFKEWYYEGKTTLPASGVINPEFQEYYHLAKDWYDADLLTKAPHTPDKRDWMVFYGGDIAGVRQSLDYLQELGVSVIYFNPLFEAKSSHKYDAVDYKKVDPHFGTNDEFIAFVKEAKKRNIRIVLDIVYNHCGNSSYMFKDAADKGPASPYYNWFDWKKHPLPQGWPNVGRPWKPADYYSCWWGFGDLPDLNFDISKYGAAEHAVNDITQAQPNIGLVKYLLDTTEYWLKTVDADGVRLDVANEVPKWFWKMFNERVKKVKPDAYIVGELWGNASEWVRPGLYDAVMNYAFFRDPVLRFLGQGQGTAAEFDATLATGRLAYPSQSVEVQMNLIDSHDTVRFLTNVGGNMARLKLASLFQMTYVGAPAIYYGDEIAMEGGRDPDCRRPFLWNWQQDPKRVDMRSWYVKLGQLRKAHVALRTGEFRTLSAQGMAIAYSRSGGGETFVVVLNAGKSPAQVSLDLSAFGAYTAKDALTGAAAAWSGASPTLTVAGETGQVFQLVRAK